MVPCETVLVKQGYFDIFFPTGTFFFLLTFAKRKDSAKWLDFELLRDTYSLIMNSPSTSFHVPSPLGTGNKTKIPVAEGFKDFFFPSTGIKGFRRRQVGIHSQADFLELYGGEECVGPTRVRDGGSVMLGMYGNAKIMF